MTLVACVTLACSHARSDDAAPGLGVRDHGIFSDLDAQVRIALPAAFERARASFVIDRARRQLLLYSDSWPVKVYPLAGDVTLEAAGQRIQLRAPDAAELAPLLADRPIYTFEARVELPPGDADDDGIPDALDVQIGSLKAALNADRYDGRYERIAYPNGDVPRSIGVCTDVVIRSLRNAGYDLQRDVHEDIVNAPSAYPAVRQPDPNIDQRRVKTLLRYCERHLEAHGTQPHDAHDPFMPGDIVFMDTFLDRPGAEHVGIVSSVRAANGFPLVINNWTDGTVTKALELLSWVPVTQRFRLKQRLPNRGPIDARRTQLLAVVSDAWADSHASLRRYERQPGRAWREVSGAVPVTLGYNGYAWGAGLHGSGAPQGRAGPIKREGDGRSPAGAFELGIAHGYAPAASEALKIPYATTTAADRCIDDPASPHYNRVVSSAQLATDWNSAERMQRDDDLYELAIEIAHNRSPTQAGAGSCIFLHVWGGPNAQVTGCTALDKAQLRSVARWLRPNALLVALPRDEYAALQRAWGLP
jgi:D-alanyl-D-alanine dipeptidase